VSKDAVKLGFIFSETGSQSSAFKDGGQACQARIDRQNAAGGVNGRKINLEPVDDQSSAANLTAAQDLVQNRNVFAVVNESGFAFLSYRYLLDAGVPMIGGGYDGSYYGQKGNENVISALGNLTPVSDISYTTVAKVIKQLGGTKTATAAYGVVPSSGAAAKAFQNYAAPALGLKGVYTNIALDLNSDVGPLVLSIKNSGADAAYFPLAEDTNLAILQGLRQNGVAMKANILATGYGQALLDSPIAQALGADTIFTQNLTPVELKTKATKQFQADLKKYAGFTSVPNFSQYVAYISCDLAIKGLQGAGQNPTRQGFVNGIRKLGTYDQAGLTCAPVGIGLDTFGKPPATQCSYFLTVKNDKFVPMFKGKPIVGKIVGSPEALKAALSGAGATTTTSPPST
jgi:branched-chain amino acid transport system substrate-binding protein